LWIYNRSAPQSKFMPPLVIFSGSATASVVPLRWAIPTAMANIASPRPGGLNLGHHPCSPSTKGLETMLPVDKSRCEWEVPCLNRWSPFPCGRGSMTYMGPACEHVATTHHGSCTTQRLGALARLLPCRWCVPSSRGGHGRSAPTTRSPRVTPRCGVTPIGHPQHCDATCRQGGPEHDIWARCGSRRIERESRGCRFVAPLRGGIGGGPATDDSHEVPCHRAWVAHDSFAYPHQR
jgi:hypothetical protein